MVQARSRLRTTLLDMYAAMEHNSRLSRARFAELTKNRGESNETVRFLAFCAVFGSKSRSQLFQDLWVLFETASLTNGFFVEFGADDGVTNSNTLLLEQAFGWKGILAEPNPAQADQAADARNAALDRRCVWSVDGVELELEVGDDPQLSTASLPGSTGSARENPGFFSVESVSLESLLNDHGAPRHINYMSIDVEGAELPIIEAFDWSSWQIDLVSIEHNGRADEAEIDQLMARVGYSRRFRELSHFDGWYRRDDFVEGPVEVAAVTLPAT